MLVSFVVNGMDLANAGLVETAIGGITQLLLMLSVFFASGSCCAPNAT